LAVAGLVREVVVRRPRLELAGAGVDRQPSRQATATAHLRLGDAADPGDSRIGEPEALRGVDVAVDGEIVLGAADRRELGREIRMEAGDLRQRVARLDALESLQQRLREGAAEAERLADGPHLGPELDRKSVV